ncbi:hypothetical protein EMGBS15_01490 [Filimonas sp.]|nr:hypothetical protein EMGBS15_01490 [Filimonas sp.]
MCRVWQDHRALPGLSGLQGSRCCRSPGAPGLQGVPGADGATGLQGPAGPQGATGGYPVHYIGESYGGGIVFYVYDNGQHGLIAATTDQSNWIQWSNGLLRKTGSTGDGVGAGAMNTAMIVATQMADSETGNFAAKVCADYSATAGDVTYGDWYLPSKHELNLMYNKIGQGAASPNTNIGGFAAAYYWSSSEYNSGLAWYQLFNDGNQFYYFKFINSAYVRAVRAF